MSECEKGFDKLNSHSCHNVSINQIICSKDSKLNFYQAIDIKNYFTLQWSNVRVALENVSAAKEEFEKCFIEFSGLNLTLSSLKVKIYQILNENYLFQSFEKEKNTSKNLSLILTKEKSSRDNFVKSLENFMRKMKDVSLQINDYEKDLEYLHQNFDSLLKKINHL